LRPRRDWPRSRATTKYFDELAPSHCLPPRLKVSLQFNLAHWKWQYAVAADVRFVAASATEADIKDLWLRMAAAWRRQAMEPPSGKRKVI
jgi:hypothetical protein